MYLDERKIGTHAGETGYEWRISWEGYFPYCSGCGYEPYQGDVVTNGLPGVCPQCGAYLANAEELNNPVRRKANVSV